MGVGITVFVVSGVTTTVTVGVGAVVISGVATTITVGVGAVVISDTGICAEQKSRNGSNSGIIVVLLLAATHDSQD
jgi:hypothetical protein